MASGSAVHSRCVQLNVAQITEASSVFAAKNEQGRIPLVLIPDHRSPLSSTGWWMTIPTGCYCLMQKFGRDCGVAPPGGKIRPPYYRIAYIVTQQSCTYNAPVKECPTADNVRVGVDCVLVFMIRDPAAFVYKLGAVHFDQLLSGAVDEGIRLMVRQQSHQTVRMLRGNRADSLLNLLNKKFEESGVVFSNCTITAVILPPQLEQSLEHTTEMKKAMERTARQHEYEMGEIHRNADTQLEELHRKHEQIIVMENGRKKRAELDNENRMVKVSDSTSTALIEAAQKAKVKKMEAQALLDRTKVNMERLRVETISKAEAEADVRRVQADIAYEQANMHAEAEKQRLVGEAQAIEVDAQAEFKSSQHLTHKRKHDLDMYEKDILMKLAQKMSYNLVGDPGDRLVDAMMTGHLTDGNTK